MGWFDDQGVTQQGVTLPPTTGATSSWFAQQGVSTDKVPAAPQAATAASQPAWRTNHPWLAAGVDAMRAGLGLQSFPTKQPSILESAGKQIISQAPEMTGSIVGQSLAVPVAGAAAIAQPELSPVSVPAIEATGAAIGGGAGRVIKYGAEKLGSMAGLPTPPPPSSLGEAWTGVKSAAKDAAVGSLLFGGYKAAKGLAGPGGLTQRYFNLVAQHLGDAGANVEAAGGRMMRGIVGQTKALKAPLNQVYDDVLSTADSAEFMHPTIGQETSPGLDKYTTGTLHQMRSDTLDAARMADPGPERWDLYDKAAKMKETIVERLNKYAAGAGDAYDLNSTRYHQMMDRQTNDMVQQFVDDPKHAVDSLFQAKQPYVGQVVNDMGQQTSFIRGAGYPKSIEAQGLEGGDKIGLLQNAMPAAAWKDTTAAALSRAIDSATLRGKLLGAPLGRILDNLGPQGADRMFGPDLAGQLRKVATLLEYQQGNKGFELAERFGAIEGIRQAVRGSPGKALLSIFTPRVAKKLTGLPEAWALYGQIVKQYPEMATSSPGQRVLAALAQAAQPDQTISSLAGTSRTAVSGAYDSIKKPPATARDIPAAPQPLR
jgi:hypothetical protein